MMDDALREIEAVIFRRYSQDVSPESLKLVFILGAPRSGSTLVYQLLVRAFSFSYLSNLMNNSFAECPAVAAFVAERMGISPPDTLQSHYGKTETEAGLSEGSAIFSHWFGGEHPAQLQSREVRPGRVDHLVDSLCSIQGITGRPLLTKNAWNCFRIRALTELFPAMQFIWVRRDIVRCAVSDLESRYRRGGPTVWNSATTANYMELQARPYWEQVVEQQYEYNLAIERDLEMCCPGRSIELWYEDLCRCPGDAVARLRDVFHARGVPAQPRDIDVPELTASGGPSGLEDDQARIEAYVTSERDRLAPHLYTHSRRSSAHGH